MYSNLQAGLLGFLLTLIAPVRPHPPSDFTLHIDGGLTNSTRIVDLPAAPPGAIGVELTVVETHAHSFGVETDVFGNTTATYSADTRFLDGWALRRGTTNVMGARPTWTSGFAGTCVPFDGVYDWAGTSGQLDSANVSSTRTETLTMAQLASAPLTLSGSSRTITLVNIGLTIPFAQFGPSAAQRMFVSDSGRVRRTWSNTISQDVGAIVVTLNTSSWSADVHGRWLF